MNQTCEFGRFYYGTEGVVLCVSFEANSGGAYRFAVDDDSLNFWYLDPKDVALIPHMTSWDYDGPRHPEEGWRFLQEDELLRSGDEYWDDADGWAELGRYAFGKKQCVGTVYRRRIEPDHVAELDKLLGNSFIADQHWPAVKAELLTLREQLKGGDV